MSKKKLHLLFIFITIILQNGYTQHNYRILEYNFIKFIIPPGKTFKIREDFELPKRFWIQSISINGLSTNYKKSIGNINKATYRHLKANGFNPDALAATKITLDNGYGEIYYNLTNVWIYLNFKEIFSNIKNESDTSLSLKFTGIALNMLMAIQSIENKNWNPSVAQNIVEKVFEMIPSPQSAVNARFGYIETPDYSLIPLSPKIHLRVDHSTFIDTRQNSDLTQIQYLNSLQKSINKADSTQVLNDIEDTIPRSFSNNSTQVKQYRYEWSGQSYVSFSKVRFGLKDVFFKFDPFISSLTPRDGTTLPTNSYPDTHRRLLSSSIDLEFTSEISNSHYLFLFQKFIRENNSNSFYGPEMEDCCRPDRARCNSLIFFRDDLDLLSEDFQDWDNSLTNYAVYGERSPIVPVIPIFIGTHMQYFPLNSTIEDLITEGYISRNFTLSRLYNDHLANVNSKSGDIILLPGDNLNNK